MRNRILCISYFRKLFPFFIPKKPDIEYAMNQNCVYIKYSTFSDISVYKIHISTYDFKFE